VIQVGQVFGRWTVIGPGGRSPRRGARWLCRCECGAIGNLRADNIIAGSTKSCGCYRRDQIAARNRGMSAPSA
jgi:hypothetical protein